jgi:hypothetical protein
MGPLAELAELTVLISMSLILVSRGIFRPTSAGLAKKRPAQPAREAPRFDTDQS